MNKTYNIFFLFLIVLVAHTDNQTHARKPEETALVKASLVELKSSIEPINMQCVSLQKQLAKLRAVIMIKTIDPTKRGKLEIVKNGAKALFYTAATATVSVSSLLLYWAATDPSFAAMLQAL